MSAKSSAGGPRGHPRMSRNVPSRYASRKVDGCSEAEASMIAKLYLSKLLQPSSFLAGPPQLGLSKPRGALSPIASAWRRFRHAIERLMVSGLQARLRRHGATTFLRHHPRR
ncbi:hypothetical protein [Pseudomonas zhanjiangensis]|uniref:Uncharacterized protein n=1 Tax=Pseudomonas zhanjiangensis TaxID=3239015 RepID=A0ABV3YXK0_9PSED